MSKPDPVAPILKTCARGHRYYKSSACPVCPVCEQKKHPGAFGMIAAPARRALENAGIRSLPDLTAFHEQDILQLHGMGPNAVSKLKEALKANGWAFRQK